MLTYTLAGTKERSASSRDEPLQHDQISSPMHSHTQTRHPAAIFAYHGAPQRSTAHAGDQLSATWTFILCWCLIWVARLGRLRRFCQVRRLSGAAVLRLEPVRTPCLLIVASDRAHAARSNRLLGT